MVGHRNLLLLGGAVLLAGIVLTALTVGGDPGQDDPDGSREGAGSDVTSGNDDPVVDRDANEGADAPAADPGSTSAAGGPEGSRDLVQAPDELPAGIVSEDATDILGRAARSGDDWSATVTYASQRGIEDLEELADTAGADAGFERRRATFTHDRKVIVYDGSDGSVLTVTLTAAEDRVIVGAVLISP